MTKYLKRLVSAKSKHTRCLASVTSSKEKQKSTHLHGEITLHSLFSCTFAIVRVQCTNRTIGIVFMILK